jgi:environmental stress-induced protein Ves
VLQGAGMTLHVDGQTTRPLLPLDPFAFSGESQVACTLLDGAIRDFNLIYAPDRYTARLQWIDGKQRLFSSAGTVLVFSVAEGLSVSAGTTSEVLGKHDCLQLDDNDELLEISVSGPCCLIELTAI